jgi:hypothetical protein
VHFGALSGEEGFVALGEDGLDRKMRWEMGSQLFVV